MWCVPMVLFLGRTNKTGWWCWVCVHILVVCLFRTLGIGVVGFVLATVHITIHLDGS
jgi:hypothetical protein